MPVSACAVPTGLDSGEPRCRRWIERIAMDATASSSDSQAERVGVHGTAPAARLGQAGETWWAYCPTCRSSSDSRPTLCSRQAYGRSSRGQQPRRVVRATPRWSSRATGAATNPVPRHPATRPPHPVTRSPGHLRTVTALLRALPSVCPALTAITVTVRRLSRIAAVSLSDAPAAPRTTAPLIRHS